MNISAMEIVLNCLKSKKVHKGIIILTLQLIFHFSQSAEEIQPYCNSQGDCNCPHGYKLIEYAHTSVCRIDDDAGEGEYQPQESCDVVNNCHRSAECEFDQATNRYECICGPGYDGEFNLNLIVGNCCITKKTHNYQAMAMIALKLRPTAHKRTSATFMLIASTTQL